LPEPAFDDGMAAFEPGPIGIEIVLGKGAAPTQDRRRRAGGREPDHGQQGDARAQDASQDLPVAQRGRRVTPRRS